MKRIFWIVILLAATVVGAVGQSQKPKVRIDDDLQIVDQKPEPATPEQVKAWHCEAPLFDLATPTQSYKTLYFAVKCKNNANIKAVLSKLTIEFMTAAAQMQKKTFDEAIVNGLTASTYSPVLPEICQERVKEKMGAVEVKRSTDGKWEDLPFIFEDGGWRLAVGDLFKETYQKPGPTRCMKISRR